jgi:hypothetical protein
MMGWVVISIIGALVVDLLFVLQPSHGGCRAFAVSARANRRSWPFGLRVTDEFLAGIERGDHTRFAVLDEFADHLRVPA